MKIYLESLDYVYLGSDGRYYVQITDADNHCYELHDFDTPESAQEFAQQVLTNE